MDELLSSIDVGDVGEDTTKADRMRNAFLESKESYEHELVVTPPGWFQTDSSSSNPRKIDWTIQRFYLQRRYTDALDLASTTLVSPSTSGGDDIRQRELLDIALHCAIRLRDPAQAISLAALSKSRWSSFPAIAASAGEAYLIGQKPKDAISPLLWAISLRGPNYAYVKLLSQAFASWDIGVGAASALHRYLQDYADRLSRPFSRPLFEENVTATWEARERHVPIPQSIIRELGSQCGLEGDELDRLVKLFDSKTVEVDDEKAERSVRTL